MTSYEYKVVPAPTKGLKAKGVKTPEGRFANSVQSVLNTQGAEGWEYLRSELLPSDERTGLTGSTTHWRNVLVFRRALSGVEVPGVQVVTIPEAAALTDEPAVVELPAVNVPAVEVPDIDVPVADMPVVKISAADEGVRREPQMASGAERMLKDDGVEEISPVSGITKALKARAEQQAGESEEGDETPKA
ncbi:MAG: DUF4177 domain-containing protein [Rhodobacteraceae bacterium]|nr:MAG: DUF4177 domain-containing protein [Paracoccaceae bacterium]